MLIKNKRVIIDHKQYRNLIKWFKIKTTIRKL